MLYTLAITMFVALAGFVASLVAGMIHAIDMPFALAGAVISILIGWACAVAIDRIERKL